MSTYNFSDKVAFVTGAASGIGQGAARQLAEGGARIVAIDRNQMKLDETVADLPSKGLKHVALVKDIRSAESSKEVVAEGLKVAGSIDILVNAAGVSHFSRINEISAEEWDEVMEIDVRALFYISVAAAEAMDPKRGGRIINLGSNAGRKGRALAAHYAAAKAAVKSLTESLTLAYGSKNIAVNTVCPAVVETPLWESNFKELTRITGKTPAQFMETWSKLTPLGRVGTTDDVANLIAFLASDKAEFITGQEINVCGGFMLTC
jgi:meso-butanediol dehydrogenase/(S,S)-butanediol dehydrogenase/diacetyl reductase